jgi:hypothetical protein
MTVDELLALEEIRNLRHAYSAAFDARDIDAFVALFTEDAVCDVGPEYGTWVGLDAIRANHLALMRLAGEPFDDLLVATNPWIRLTGPTTAHGRWYLLDLLTRQKPVTGMASIGGHDNPLFYLAVYEDDYRKVNGVWKIAYCKLNFLWPKRAWTGLRHP